MDCVALDEYVLAGNGYDMEGQRRVNSCGDATCG